jgi:hypothetical protein
MCWARPQALFPQAPSTFGINVRDQLSPPAEPEYSDMFTVTAFENKPWGQNLLFLKISRVSKSSY